MRAVGRRAAWAWARAGDGFREACELNELLRGVSGGAYEYGDVFGVPEFCLEWNGTHCGYLALQ